MEPLLLFAAPIRAEATPMANETVFDADAFLTQFIGVFATFHTDRPQAEIAYQRMIEAAYDDMQEMGKRINSERTARRLAIRRVRLVYEHIRSAAAPKHFRLGETVTHGADEGTIIAMIGTPLGAFYRLETLAGDIVEIYGG